MGVDLGPDIFNIIFVKIQLHLPNRKLENISPRAHSFDTFQDIIESQSSLSAVTERAIE